MLMVEVSKFLGKTWYDYFSFETVSDRDNGQIKLRDNSDITGQTQD